MQREYAFEIASSTIRYGVGVTREVGMDLADLHVRRAMVVTDAHLAKLAPVAAVLESLKKEGVQFSLSRPGRLLSLQTCRYARPSLLHRKGALMPL